MNKYNVSTPEKVLLSKLDRIGVISPEATQAASAIRQHQQRIGDLESTVLRLRREADAMRAALSLDCHPIDSEIACSLVSLLCSKYYVGGHFDLTAEDVANLINHVRIVKKQ